MPQPFGPRYVEGATALWNRFFPEKYEIDAPGLVQHSIDSPTFDWGASVVEVVDHEVVGIALVKKSPARFYSGPNRDTYHLSALAFDHATIGVDLLAHVKSILRDRGADALVYGQDSGHFFPGCPSEVTALCDFLTVSGFEGSSTAVDLERDLTGYVPASFEAAEFRYLRSEEHEELNEFFLREFPHRWRYDVLRKLEQEPKQPCVFVMLVDGKIEGFALLQSVGCVSQIGGAVWHRSLGPQWGSLGPIGISQRIRGQGFGGAILDQALGQLAKDGARQTIIDWTTLIDFYGKFGFEVTRTYRQMIRNLNDS
jgi:GNAT superfamily N-acetyltransferase